MKRNLILVLAVSILVSSCAIASKTYAPDGREAFSISCDGLANSWSKCFKKAGDICQGNGYDTFTQSSDGGVLVSATPTVATGGSVVNRTLLVACKVPQK